MPQPSNAFLQASNKGNLPFLPIPHTKKSPKAAFLFKKQRPEDASNVISDVSRLFMANFAERFPATSVTSATPESSPATSVTIVSPGTSATATTAASSCHDPELVSVREEEFDTKGLRNNHIAPLEDQPELGRSPAPMMEVWTKGEFTRAKKTLADVVSKVHFLQPAITKNFDLDCYLCNMKNPTLSTHALESERVPGYIFAAREYRLIVSPDPVL
ncbi:hypothetical protein ACO0QE_003644 [Hanseniaspora vineae]